MGTNAAAGVGELDRWTTDGCTSSVRFPRSYCHYQMLSKALLLLMPGSNQTESDLSIVPSTKTGVPMHLFIDPITLFEMSGV